MKSFLATLRELAITTRLAGCRLSVWQHQRDVDRARRGLALSLAALDAAKADDAVLHSQLPQSIPQSLLRVVK